VVASAAASHTSKYDWGVAAEMVTYRKMEWAINTFLPYKSLGMDGIFPALPQQGQRVVIPYLIKIFRACLAMGYVPAIWRQVKVEFMPKPGKNSYTGPRDFRPTSLTSFLLKMLERLVDRYIRDGALVIKPLHPNQHAYQAGKSVETAFHQLVVRVEKALDQQELALGAFLDTEGGYKYTSFDSMCTALCGRGDDSTIVQWIRATLEGRLAMAALNDVCVRVAVARGCPHGGVLSPLLWCVVVDDLIARLNMGWVYC
jgi:hypothetical protein